MEYNFISTKDLVPGKLYKIFSYDKQSIGMFLYNKNINFMLKPHFLINGVVKSYPNPDVVVGMDIEEM